MTEVIGVKFKKVGKIYFFSPGGLKIDKGAHVIVETARGLEYGEVTFGNRLVEESEVVQPLKKVTRIATDDDNKKDRENRRKEEEAQKIFREKIAHHKLEMSLVDVEYTFDNSKVLFYFTADGRVDFRNLVKDLAAVLKTRIELRQIGVRDESKLVGGLGICGQQYCCSRFLSDFQPVSIKMAKEQGLSLNPTKISGSCGRLMCCLKYEQDAYEELLKITPKIGALVKTPDGDGYVTEVNMLRGKLFVRMKKDPEAAPRAFLRSQVKVIRDAEIKLEQKEIEELKRLEE